MMHTGLQWGMTRHLDASPPLLHPTQLKRRQHTVPLTVPGGFEAHAHCGRSGIVHTSTALDRCTVGSTTELGCTNPENNRG